MNACLNSKLLNGIPLEGTNLNHPTLIVCHFLNRHAFYTCNNASVFLFINEF